MLRVKNANIKPDTISILITCGIIVLRPSIIDPFTLTLVNFGTLFLAHGDVLVILGTFFSCGVFIGTFLKTYAAYLFQN